MTKENLEKCIVLIGPSCVGKSLISFELSQKTKMPKVCLDDLMVMVEYEKDGEIGPDISAQKEFSKKLLKKVLADVHLQRNFALPKFEKKTFELIKEIVDLYNQYLTLFGSLEPFYEILEKYQMCMVYSACPIERLTNLNIMSVDVLEKVFELVDEPIIIDSPAPFGWKSEDQEHKLDLEMGDLKQNTSVDFDEINLKMFNILTTAKTVLLCPGEDYDKRNTVKTSIENNILLESLNNYFDHAEIMITTNAMFNQPENKFMQKRSWLNAEESIEREKLKNQSEINNICDQILTMAEEMNQTI